MSLEAKVITGAKWSAIGAWSRKLVGFFVFMILARLIDPESMGLVALAGVYIAFAEMICRQGVGMAIIQTNELTNSYLDNAYALNTLTAILMAVLSCVFAGHIADFLGDPRLKTIIMVLAINFPINAMVIVPVALQTREFHNKKIAMQTFASSVVSACIAVPMAYAGFEVWALVAQAVTSSTSYVVLVKINSKWRYGSDLNKSELKKLLNFSLKVTASNFTAFARNRSDQLIVGWLAGPAGIGFYSVAHRLITTIESFTNAPVDKVAMPAFSRVQDDREKLESALNKACRLNAAIVAPIFMGVAATAGELIPLAFGPNWTQAVPVGTMLSFMFLSKTLFFFIWPLLMSVGRAGTVVWFQACHAVGIIPAAYIGSEWGIGGIAAGVFISTLIVSIIWTAIICRLLHIRFSSIINSLTLPVVVSGIMFATVWFVRIELIKLEFYGFFVLLLCGMLGACVYIVGMKLFANRLFNELLSVIRKSVGKA